MKIVDANILLYAVDRESIHHKLINNWWQDALAGDEPIGFAWLTVNAFLRLVTQPLVFREPLTVEQAISLVDEWLNQPVVKVVSESSEHWQHMQALLEEAGTAGNLTNDAHLAAIAVSLGASVVSCDRDFGRFRHLRWENPLVRNG
jgi:toxin-antitoxin system PIN domain toxin